MRAASRLVDEKRTPDEDYLERVRKKRTEEGSATWSEREKGREREGRVPSPRVGDEEVTRVGETRT